MIGAPAVEPTGDGFRIAVVNDGETPDTVTYVYFAQAPAESCYMNTLAVDGTAMPGYPLISNGRPAAGLGDTAYTNSTVVVPPEMSAEVLFGFHSFVVDSLNDTLMSNIRGKTFTFRFSDGSEITVTPP